MDEIAVPVDLLRALIKLAVQDADLYDERAWEIIDAARALLRVDD